MLVLSMNMPHIMATQEHLYKLPRPYEMLQRLRKCRKVNHVLLLCLEKQ